MPFSEQHQRKKYKNIAMLVGLCGLIVLFYALTIVKFSQGM